MKKTFRGLFMLALACIGLAAMPSAANAQSTVSCQDSVSTKGAEAFFNVAHIIPGLPLPCADNEALRRGEAVIYSTFNTSELREIIAEYGVTSDKVRKFVDSKLSKEGNTFRIITRMGGHVYEATRTKGVDWDSNITTINVYVIANDSNGQPVTRHTAQGANWQSTFGTAMASAMGQTAVNVATLGTQTGLQELTRPDCDKGSCAQQVFNFAGGNAISGSTSNSSSAVAANLATLIDFGGCGSSGACPTTQPNPYPTGSAPAVGMVNPNGPGQH